MARRDFAQSRLPLRLIYEESFNRQRMEQLSAFGWDMDLLRQLQGLLIALGIGFANMDAITVSMSEYASGGNHLQVAGVAIVLATITNTLVKYGFCVVFGNRRLRQQSSIGFALILLVAGGYIWWQI